MSPRRQTPVSSINRLGTRGRRRILHESLADSLTILLFTYVPRETDFLGGHRYYPRCRIGRSPSRHLWGDYSFRSRGRLARAESVGLPTGRGRLTDPTRASPILPRPPKPNRSLCRNPDTHGHGRGPVCLSGPPSVSGPGSPGPPSPRSPGLVPCDLGHFFLLSPFTLSSSVPFTA